MNDQIARAALMRMNLREIAVASFQTTIAADMQALASAKHEDEQAKFMEQRRDELCAAYGFGASNREKPFAFANGIAIIPFTGSLINRFGWSYGFVTGYNFVRRQLALALADEDVKGIVGDFNTYGGEAAGCFECSDEIYAARGQKPMIAVVDSNCYSAGYALASAFDKIICTPSGGVGSIGVVGMHIDMSKMLEKIGIDITFIHFGDHKVDGNPYEPLPAEVKASMQKGINKSGENFVALVARNMNLDAKLVRDTQAAVYRAEEALELGLIHTIATPSQAVQVFFDELSGSATQLKQEVIMTTTTNEPGGTTQAAADQAAKDARTAERARVNGILTCEEAKGRSDLANHLAMNTEMSVDEAKAILKAAPVAAAASTTVTTTTAAANPFQAAMDATPNPNLSAEGGAGTTEMTAAEQILQSQSKATGLKLVNTK